MADNDIFGNDDDSGTVFRDVITLALCGFVAIVLLLLPHLNPPVNAATIESITAPGNVVVEIRWPDELDTDVDLWVQGPGDAPVGYSNKGGRLFNLLRDDLGKFGDATDLNYEIAYSRGMPPGEYTVNVHLYRNLSGVFPIPITVAVSFKQTADAPAKQLLATKLELRREGEELTAFRFTLDDAGRLVTGSVHNLYRPLRSSAPG
ncbi:MAG: hypothetical protein HY057_15065 [Rhodospirillales bacterium]|nr:hypothetical protein [Rhodospirillales bacterium]